VVFERRTSGHRVTDHGELKGRTLERGGGGGGDSENWWGGRFSYCEGEGRSARCRICWRQTERLIWYPGEERSPYHKDEESPQDCLFVLVWYPSEEEYSRFAEVEKGPLDCLFVDRQRGWFGILAPEKKKPTEK